MDKTQILAIAVGTGSTMLTVMIGILLNNARLSDMNARIAELRSHMDNRFDQVDDRFAETKDLWRSELRRVEEVLDARLKHIEDR